MKQFPTAGLCDIAQVEELADARSGESYVTGETMIDAYWHILFAGMGPGDGFEAGRNAFTFFDDWGSPGR
jgi:hypothetical protein